MTNIEKNINLKERTKRFGIDVIRFCFELPNKVVFQIIGKQLLRSATSFGANYRSACRAKSKADFINKLSIVEEEADEASYWMEIIEELLPNNNTDLQQLKDEANQLISICVASKKTSRANSEFYIRKSSFDIRNSTFANRNSL